MYELPIFVNIGGQKFNIRNKGDYRVVLDSIIALNDIDLLQEEKVFCLLNIFYEDYTLIPKVLLNDAICEIVKFINCGEMESDRKSHVKLMDWGQDFKLIIAPINRVIGEEIRSIDYLHWWTFISAYYEIGECSFSSVISIRQKKQKGKKLEKWEQEFLRENKDLVELRTKASRDEQDMINEIMGIE